jgi:hypothetical protein
LSRSNAKHVEKTLERYGGDGWKNINYNDATFKISKGVIRLIGNTYNEVSMGVTNQHQGTYYRGSLLKFNNIFAVELIDETFTNISPFHTERFCEVFTQINGDTSCTIPNKPSLDLKYWQNLIYGTMVNHGFFQNELSASLIYGNIVGSLKILGKSRFQNVWLIDRKNALLLNQDEGNTKYGLILYFRALLGQVQIGGVSSYSRYNASE